MHEPTVQRIFISILLPPIQKRLKYIQDVESHELLAWILGRTSSEVVPPRAFVVRAFSGCVVGAMHCTFLEEQDRALPPRILSMGRSVRVARCGGGRVGSNSNSMSEDGAAAWARASAHRAIMHHGRHHVVANRWSKSPVLFFFK